MSVVHARGRPDAVERGFVGLWLPSVCFWADFGRLVLQPLAVPTKHKFVTCRGVEGGALVDEPGGSVRKHCTDTRNTENTAACTSACTILRFVAMTLGIRILHGVHFTEPKGSLSHYYSTAKESVDRCT